MTELRMLESTWASEYLRGLFGREGKSLEDLDDLVLASEILAMEDPSLELIFLRQGNSSAQGFNLAIAMLALCDKEAPVAPGRRYSRDGSARPWPFPRAPDR